MSEADKGRSGSEGPLTGWEYVQLLAGVPLSLAVLAVELDRVWAGLRGGPLLITGLTDPHVTVRWSVNRLHFAAGLLLHLVIILFFAALLASLYTLARRWRSGGGG